MPAPSKESQIAESNARTQSGADSPADRQAALDVIDDVARGATDDGGQRSAPTETDPTARQTPRPSHDNKRDEIVARFRQHRAEKDEADREDISDFARSGMPPEFDQYREGEDRATNIADNIDRSEATEPPAADAPKLPPRVKLKVHGEEKEYALDDVIAQAQIALASDNILGKAKSKLQEVDDLLRDTRTRAARPDQTGHHADQTRPQPTDASAQSDDPPTSDDPLAKLIETIQFGDPNEAQPLLRQTIANEVSRVVTQHIQADRMKNEGVRAAKTIADFSKDHPDLVTDPYANAVMQMRIFEIQRGDLEAIGVTPESLQSVHGRPPTPGDISEAHKWYRSEGVTGLHTPQAMLEEAYGHFQTWKEVKVPDPTPQPADTERAPPRVEVNVNRDTRRAAIPQSPTRTAVPMQAPQGNPGAVRRDSSLVVQQMNQKRNAPRGRVA